MKGAKIKLLVGLALVLLLALLLTAGIFVSNQINGNAEDSLHYERDETELVVVNTTGAAVRLFRAGNTMADVVPVPEFAGERMWLSAGSYFLEVSATGSTVYYPVTIRGYRQGNEEDGTFSVTLRPIPEEPPVLNKEFGSFRPIPSGSFLFGDRLNPNEPHFVWIPAFFLAEFEVTNADFREFVTAADGFSDPANWTAAGNEWKKRRSNRPSAELQPIDEDYERFGQPDMPVTRVTWFEAAAYCRWLTRKLGNEKWVFSLPTEAEWEKAARGPDDFDYPLGRNLSDAETPLYNWKKNPLAPETVIGISKSRNAYRPNRYGVFHLGGNVVEWTQTIHRPFNRNKPWADDDRNREDLPGTRVARGGSWYSASNALLYIAYRDTFTPELSNHDLGFRVAARRLS